MTKRPEARIRVYELPSHWEDLISDDPWFGEEEHARMKSKALPDLPFGITRDGFYSHPPTKKAWVVVGGVAYEEDFAQEQYEFESGRYETIGWEKYQTLRKIWMTLRKGPDRDVIGKILGKEENYWQLRGIRRGKK
jgi:hypothetical protein